MAKWYVTHSIKLGVEATNQEQAEDKSFDVLLEQFNCSGGVIGELIDWKLDTELGEEE